MISIGIIFLTSLYVLNIPNKDNTIKGGSDEDDKFAKYCKELIAFNPKRAHVIGSYAKLGKSMAGDIDIKEIEYDTTKTIDILRLYGLKMKRKFSDLSGLQKISLKYRHGQLVQDNRVYQILQKIGSLNALLQVINYDDTLKNENLSFLDNDSQEIILSYINSQTPKKFLDVLSLFIKSYTIDINDLIEGNFYRKDIIRLRVDIIKNNYKIEYGLDFGKFDGRFKIDIKDFLKRDASISYYSLLKKYQNIFKRGVYILKDFTNNELHEAMKTIESINLFRNKYSSINQDIVKYQINGDIQGMKRSDDTLNSYAKELVDEIQKEFHDYLSSFYFTNDSFYASDN